MATDTQAPTKDDAVPPPVKERSLSKPVFTDAEAGAREFPSSTSRTITTSPPPSGGRRSTRT